MQDKKKGRAPEKPALKTIVMIQPRDRRPDRLQFEDSRLSDTASRRLRHFSDLVFIVHPESKKAIFFSV